MASSTAMCRTADARLSNAFRGVSLSARRSATAPLAAPLRAQTHARRAGGLNVQVSPSDTHSLRAASGSSHRQSRPVVLSYQGSVSAFLIRPDERGQEGDALSSQHVHSSA